MECDWCLLEILAQALLNVPIDIIFAPCRVGGSRVVALRSVTKIQFGSKGASSMFHLNRLFSGAQRGRRRQEGGGTGVSRNETRPDHRVAGTDPEAHHLGRLGHPAPLNSCEGENKKLEF